LYLYVGIYNAPLTFVLGFLPILMLNVYMWGYFRPTYICRSNIFVPRDRGVTRWYQSL